MAMPGKPFGWLGKRSRGWLECAILAFGIPALALGLSKAITQVIPAALHGSTGQRFLLNISGGLVAEWFFVIALWFILRARNESFRDLGVWRSGRPGAWVLALAVAALTIGSNLRFLPKMHIPISYAFAPRGFHLVAALALGITAGFCEEVLFRGFLITEFARAGYGKAMQVIIPGLSFGFAHVGYTVHGIGAGLGITVPTALVGMMWGVAYLLGRRSLLPCVIAHFLNDSTALPWVIFSLSGLS
jgi:membrane protease YdiL (CAAX protease family)